MGRNRRAEVRFWEWWRVRWRRQKAREEYREEEYWDGGQDNAEKVLEDHNSKYGWLF